MLVRSQLILALAGVLVVSALAQERPRLRTYRVPPNLQSELNAQGDRFRRGGLERVVVSGQLTDARGSKPVTMTRDIRGRFRIAVQGRVLAFDGAQTRSGHGGLRQDETAAAESLIDDSVEQFFAAVDRGDSLRLIGRRFRTDDGSTPNYTGPLHDIYELRWRDRDGNGSAARVKLFYFESMTGRLARVHYETPRGAVDTLLSDWREVAGQWIPHRIERLVDGKSTLTFFANSSSLDAHKLDSAFTAAN